jgi:hypothetical protein
MIEFLLGLWFLITFFCVAALIGRFSAKIFNYDCTILDAAGYGCLYIFCFLILSGIVLVTGHAVRLAMNF